MTEKHNSKRPAQQLVDSILLCKYRNSQLEGDCSRGLVGAEVSSTAVTPGYNRLSFETGKMDKVMMSGKRLLGNALAEINLPQGVSKLLG